MDWEIKRNLRCPESEAKGILGLRSTRWTVRVSCLERILQLRSSSSGVDNSLDSEKLLSDVRGRIFGCQAQMSNFDFFFALNFGQRLFFFFTQITHQEPYSKQRSAGHPDLELRGVGGGEEGGGTRFCFTCPVGFSSFCHFFFFTQNKGDRPPGRPLQICP